MPREPISAPFGVNVLGLPLAGFQLTLIGRIWVIPEDEEHEFSDRFVAHMLKRNVRIEEDLVDQLFNSSEKRLARALLLVARYGNNQSR
jgi:hypothetical protein